jgi:hypothetical protein
MKSKYVILNDECMFAVKNIIAIYVDSTELRFKVFDGLNKLLDVKDSPHALVRPSLRDLIAKDFFCVDFGEGYYKVVYVNKRNAYAMVSYENGIVLQNGMGIAFNGLSQSNYTELMKKIIKYTSEVTPNKVIKK